MMKFPWNVFAINFSFCKRWPNNLCTNKATTAVLLTLMLSVLILHQLRNSGSKLPRIKKGTLAAIVPADKPINKPAELVERKRILLWTPHYDKSDIRDYFLGNVQPFSQSEICLFKCDFTLDKNLLNSSHAVAFHGRGISKRGNILDLPTTRIASQFWIYYLWESPLVTHEMDTLANLFNTTMTHRQDSDIFVPNARLVKSFLMEDPEILNIVKKKTKLVVWLNSDCITNYSQRKNRVAELQKYVQVDVYGGCGPHKCISDQFFRRKDSSWWYKTFINPCYNETGQYYKFYLAFENALCKDYITEKPFNALAAGMVPIVYGGANYSLYLPQGSYINVDSFASMKDLADYLHMLDRNPEEYLKFFDWRKTLKVDEVPFMARGWCTLCEKLTLNVLPKKAAIQDFKTWWIGENSSYCLIPNI